MEKLKKREACRSKRKKLPSWGMVEEEKRKDNIYIYI